MRSLRAPASLKTVVVHFSFSKGGALVPIEFKSWRSIDAEKGQYV